MIHNIVNSLCLWSLHNNFTLMTLSLISVFREEKEKLKVCKNEDEDAKNGKVATLNWLMSKVDELSSVQEKVIEENKEWQDCKRKLQACIQDIEAPLQIAQECLYHRESRNSWFIDQFTYAI